MYPKYKRFCISCLLLPPGSSTGGTIISTRGKDEYISVKPYLILYTLLHFFTYPLYFFSSGQVLRPGSFLEPSLSLLASVMLDNSRKSSLQPGHGVHHGEWSVLSPQDFPGELPSQYFVILPVSTHWQVFPISAIWCPPGI